MEVDLKDEYYDKGKVLDRTLEQFAFAGIGTARSDLYPRRFFHFALVGKGRIDRAFGYRGALLTDYRRPHSHAVRVA
jgi:hypothetical protein